MIINLLGIKKFYALQNLFAEPDSIKVLYTISLLQSLQKSNELPEINVFIIDINIYGNIAGPQSEESYC